MPKYEDLIIQAEAILQDQNNWINDAVEIKNASGEVSLAGWMQRQVLYMKLLPLVYPTQACRVRELDLLRTKNPNKQESLSCKIDLGRRRICQHVEHVLNKEFDCSKELIRLIKPKFKLYECNGQKKTLKEWGMALNLSPQTLTKRLQDGWSVERALSTTKYPVKYPTKFSRTYPNSFIYDLLLSIITNTWISEKYVKTQLRNRIDKDMILDVYHNRASSKKRYHEKFNYQQEKMRAGRTISEEKKIISGINEIFSRAKTHLKNKGLVEVDNNKNIRKISQPKADY